MRLSFLSLCLIMFVSASLLANELQRSLTLSSGYVERYFNSNESLIYAPLSAIQAHSKLFDVATASFRHHWAQRSTNALLDAIVSFWLAPALSVPVHEFGHGRAMHALGFPHDYGSYAYGHHFQNISSYWTLSGIRLISPPWPLPGSGIAYTSASGLSGELSREMYEQKGQAAGLTLMITTAGLNNQMLLAKEIGRMLYEHNGHPSYLAHYLENKIHGFVYTALDDFDPNHKSNGDPRKIVDALKVRGIKAQSRHLKFLYLTSLISGSTASLSYGYYRYIVHNDSVITPLEFFGIRAPELNGYLTTQGLSFEIESDYRITDYLTTGLGYEFVWLGKNTHEFSPRVRYNLASALPALNEFWLTTNLVIGKGLGGSLAADYAPLAIDTTNFWSRFSYAVDVRIFHAGTLYGERNIVALDRGNIMAADAALSVRLRY